MIDLGILSKAVINVVSEAKIVSEDKKITVGELTGIINIVTDGVIEALNLKDKIVIDLEKK